MKFEKKTKTPEELVLLLQSRGLRVENEELAKNTLRYIGYYRFSGYAYPFLKDKENHLFRQGISFENIMMHYVFDKELRLLIADALERIEIAIRITISDYMSSIIHPHWFIEPTHFSEKYTKNSAKQESEHDTFLEKMRKTTEKRKELFFQHYYNKYTEPPFPPSWMLIEALEFGTLSFLYSNLANQYKTGIAKKFEISRKDMTSWLHALSYLRNLCAHHARVYNRNFTITPDKSGVNKECFSLDKKVFNHLVVIQIFLRKIAPENEWKNSLQALLQKHSIDPKHMGFPNDWQTKEPWSS